MFFAKESLTSLFFVPSQASSPEFSHQRLQKSNSEFILFINIKNQYLYFFNTITKLVVKCKTFFNCFLIKTKAVFGFSYIFQ